MSQPPYGAPPPPPPEGEGYQQYQSPGQYQSPYGAPYGGFNPPPSAGTNGLAIASLVVSLVSIVCCGPLGIVGAILGHVALGQIKRDGSGGRGMALAGVIIGWIWFTLSAVVIAGYIWLFATADCSSTDSDWPVCGRF